jgi:hypothetical protein
MMPASPPARRAHAYEWPVMAVLTLVLLITLYRSAQASQRRLEEARQVNDAALADLKVAVNRYNQILPILAQFQEFAKTDADAAALVRKYGLVVQMPDTNSVVLPTHL